MYISCYVLPVCSNVCYSGILWDLHLQYVHLYLWPGWERWCYPKCSSCPHWTFISEVMFVRKIKFQLLWIWPMLLKGWPHNSGSRVAKHHQDPPTPPRTPFTSPCTHRSLALLSSWVPLQNFNVIESVVPTPNFNLGSSSLPTPHLLTTHDLLHCEN